jgi:hypothetical protein
MGNSKKGKGPTTHALNVDRHGALGQVDLDLNGCNSSIRKIFAVLRSASETFFRAPCLLFLKLVQEQTDVLY